MQLENFRPIDPSQKGKYKPTKWDKGCEPQPGDEGKMRGDPKLIDEGPRLFLTTAYRSWWFTEEYLLFATK